MVSGNQMNYMQFSVGTQTARVRNGRRPVSNIINPRVNYESGKIIASTNIYAGIVQIVSSLVSCVTLCLHFYRFNQS